MQGNDSWSGITLIEIAIAKLAIDLHLRAILHTSIVDCQQKQASLPLQDGFGRSRLFMDVLGKMSGAQKRIGEKQWNHGDQMEASEA